MKLEINFEIMEKKLIETKCGKVERICEENTKNKLKDMLVV